MNRTYLFVPPEERSEVETLGACWDSEKKCWYVDGEPSSNLARWMAPSEDEEYSIISNDASVASTTIPCPHCQKTTEIVCVHCLRGTASGQSLEQFTVFDISAVDETLLHELERWPNYHRRTEADGIGDFANHCTFCGGVIGDIDLHSEPDHIFFDVVHAQEGTITFISLPQTIRLNGSEHFVIE
jgi:hypothetical protein